MNPETNKFESLFGNQLQLLRADGTPVPEHWSQFTQGEHVIVKNYTFKVGYIGESVLVLEPVGQYIIGDSK